MTDKILVTYASRTGTTAGVAEVIGRVLADGGASVDVRPMEAVTDLSVYTAVVAGSAIQGAEWLPEALRFMRGNRAELLSRPFAAFTVCMTLAMHDNRYQDEVTKWLQPVCELVPPVSEGYFAGALDISKVPSLKARLNFRASVLLKVWSEGDHRDWEAIAAWAESLRPLLVRDFAVESGA
jgi:menaquinone-dependent protoporphyrinogen oxidase